MLQKLLNTNVQDFFRVIHKSHPTNDDSDQSFRRVAESGRIIRAYSGVLPSAKRTARHLLRCEHLRDIPGEGFSPYRAESHYTHQIWLWYRLNTAPQKLILLFRGQFDFTFPKVDADWVAGEVADFLAYLLMSDSQHYLAELFRHEHSDIFWTLAVEKKIKHLGL